VSSHNPDADSYTDAQTSQPTTNPLTAADLLDALANERRQFVIREVADADCTLSELATALARVEADEETEYGYDQRKAAYVGLYQHHLDALADHDVVAWNDQSGLVTAGPNHDVALRTLEFVTDELRAHDLRADGGVVEEPDDDEPVHVSLERFECFGCGFEDADRDAFDTDGLAMKCPDCGSLRVEHVFTVNDEDAEVMADGGVTWTDLTGFKRDCLEAIRRLENDGETTYGLAIKRELERVYGEEILHGRLYPNLDDLVDAGLVEKGELDKRTNSYELTAEGESMLDQRARLLADACGMEQPVADGGDSA